MQVIYAMFTNLSTFNQIILNLKAMKSGLVNPSIKVLPMPA
jgi:hypothetical protein